MTASQIETLAQRFNQPVITDGIVDEKSYEKARTKILWVMKEANSTGEDEAWDMRGAIRDLRTAHGISKGWGNTFKKIVYVSNGILNDIGWCDELFHPGYKPEVIDELKKIAYINIKKTGGGARTKEEELWEHYRFSKKLLFQQINGFKPDIIIFGGTFKFFKKDLHLGEMRSYGSCMATHSGGVIYIDAYHPAYAIKEQVYVSDIFRAVNLEIR